MKGIKKILLGICLVLSGIYFQIMMLFDGASSSPFGFIGILGFPLVIIGLIYAISGYRHRDGNEKHGE